MLTDSRIMAAQDSDEYLIAQVDLLASAIKAFQTKFDEQLQALAFQTSEIAKAVQDHRKRHKPDGGFTDALRSSSSASSHHDGSMNSGQSSQTNRWLASGPNASSRKSTPDRAQKLGNDVPRARPPPPPPPVAGAEQRSVSPQVPSTPGLVVPRAAAASQQRQTHGSIRKVVKPSRQCYCNAGGNCKYSSPGNYKIIQHPPLDQIRNSAWEIHGNAITIVMVMMSLWMQIRRNVGVLMITLRGNIAGTLLHLCCGVWRATSNVRRRTSQEPSMIIIHTIHRCSQR